MTVIKKIGSPLEVDSSGYFINPCSIEKIADPWLAVVKDIVDISQANLGAGLLSVYIRGSLARGTNVKNVSDVDSFVIVKGNRWAIDLAWIDETIKHLDDQYSFHTGVEIQCVSDDEILESQVPESVRFTIKVLSSCVYGDDIARFIPPYRPGIYLAEELNQFPSALNEVQSRLTQEKLESDTVRDICRWLMKTFVRAGQSLVLNREKTYSRDLYPCFSVFCKHYPAQAAEMEKALSLAINPIDDVAVLKEFSQSFGHWIETEISRVYPQWQI